MSQPFVVCAECGQSVTVTPDGRGFPPDIARRRTRARPPLLRGAHYRTATERAVVSTYALATWHAALTTALLEAAKLTRDAPSR